jgi:hypothetical protein
VNDWNLSRDGLHINRRVVRHVVQLYSIVSGISGKRQKMRGVLTCMAVGTSSKGTSGEKRIAAIHVHMAAAWKMTESDEPTAKPERRETEYEAEEEIVGVAGGTRLGVAAGKLQEYLQ